MNFSRGTVVLDFIRKFKLADKDSVEQEYTRLYNICIPMNSPYEEVYGVLAEAISDVKKMEEDEIKRKEAEKAQELKDASGPVETAKSDLN